MRRAWLLPVLILAALAACTPTPAPAGTPQVTPTATRAAMTVATTPTAGPHGTRTATSGPARGTTTGTATLTATHVPTRASTTPARTGTPMPPLQLPDGVAALLYVRRGDASLWNGTRNQALATGAPVALAPSPRVAPDGRRVLVVRTVAGAGVAYARQILTVIDLRTRSEVTLDLASLPAPQGGWPYVVSADWLPDSSSLLLCTLEVDAQSAASTLAMADEYWRADASTGVITPVADLDGTPGSGSVSAGAAVLAPSGLYAAIPAADALHLLDLRQAQVTTLLPFGAGGAMPVFPALGWAPASDVLYAATPVGQGSAVAFWRIDIANGGVIELGRLPAAVVDLAGHPPRWSPDGSWVTWANDAGLGYLAPAGEPSRLQPWGTRRVAELLAWSPDGGSFAAASNDGRLLVLSPTDRSETPLVDYVPAGDTPVWQAIWSGPYLIASARQVRQSVVVIFGPGGTSIASGPAADWGFAPVAVPLR